MAAAHRPARVLLVFLLLVMVSFAGCLESGASWLGRDPVAQSTFTDAGSNNTTWALHITGRFHLPAGTTLQIAADNASCSTGPVVPLRPEPAGHPCLPDGRKAPRFHVEIDDLDGDGRPSHEDHMRIVPGPAHHNGTLYGMHRLRMALHPELPLFVLEQDFGAHGPAGELKVELLG